MNTKLLTCVAYCLVVLGSAKCFGQLRIEDQENLPEGQAVDENLPRTYHLHVHPAAAPNPALKYEFLPPQRNLKPGNAAPFYYRAILAARQVPQALNAEHARQQRTWQTAPLSKLPREEITKWLNAHEAALTELHEATAREECDWNLRPMEFRGLEVINVRLDEFQGLRQLVWVLRMKIRYALADGKTDEAFQAMQMGYRMAHDAGQAPFLICQLVGLAISDVLSEAMAEFIATEHAPNLYWSMLARPRPFIDLRHGLETERNTPEQLFPWLKDAETRQRTPDEWRTLLLDSMQLLSNLSANSNTNGGKVVFGTLWMMRAYPEAKRELQAAGFDAERLNEMPVGQAIAIHTARQVRYVYDEYFKTLSLPYPQAAEFSERVTQQLRVEGFLEPTSNYLPIANYLLPAYSSVIHAGARSERNLNALAAVEAIRMQVAFNKGRLPTALDEITVAPVPLDSATGKPFGYRVTEGKAILDAPALPPFSPRVSGRRFVIEFKP